MNNRLMWMVELVTFIRNRFLLVLLLALHAARASVHAQEPPRFIAGPASRGAPDDLEQELSSFIGDACCTLDILVQEWDNEKLARVLLDRVRGLPTSRRHLKVRAVVEMDYLLGHPARFVGVEPDGDESGGKADGFRPAGSGDGDSAEETPAPDSLEKNRMIMLDFWRYGIDARPDYNPAIFHDKFVVRDYGKPTEALWTGSMNFTETDARLNFNNAVIFREPEIVKAYRDKFREAWTGAFGRRVKKTAKTLDPVPLASGGTARIVFTPNNDAEAELVSLIDGAKQEVRFAIFTFSATSALTDALLRARERGAACTGLFDVGQASHPWSPDERLEQAGCKVLRSPPPGKLHHKFLIVDGKWLATGSFNYTRPANELNDENVVITDSVPVVEAALKEHRRMVDDFGGRRHRKS